MPGGAIIGNPPYAQDFTFNGAYTSITLETEPASEAVRAQVSKVQFVVSMQTFVASRSQDLNKPNSYYWTTDDPCRDLPQGNNLPLKYEMLDANNKVVQEARATVNIQTCW